MHSVEVRFLGGLPNQLIGAVCWDTSGNGGYCHLDGFEAINPDANSSRSMKELLFSVTTKDLRIDTFRAGGPGGQNQNKRETGVRITHPESGAVGESREFKSQEQNKKAAFRRMAESKTFRAWIKVESARRMGHLADIERVVDKQMNPKHLLIEGKSEEGTWVKI